MKIKKKLCNVLFSFVHMSLFINIFNISCLSLFSYSSFQNLLGNKSLRRTIHIAIGSILVLEVCMGHVLGHLSYEWVSDQG